MSESTVGAWVVDPAGSNATFESKTFWGLVTVRGTFGGVTGSGTVADDGTFSGELVIDATKLDTKNKKRDVHLRSADFFASDKYPDIVFTVTGVAPSGGGVTVTGQLTVRDQTRPVSFDAAVAAAGAGEVVLDAEVPFDRTDFGLTWNQLGMSSVHSIIAIHAVFSRG